MLSFGRAFRRAIRNNSKPIDNSSDKQMFRSQLSSQERGKSDIFINSRERLLSKIWKSHKKRLF